MTTKEAIKWLKYMISDDCTDSQYKFVDEVEFAIEALEKQIPKNPKMWSENSRWSLIPFELPFGDWGYECPCCGSHDIDYPNHRCKCGQALKWGGEKE